MEAKVFRKEEVNWIEVPGHYHGHYQEGEKFVPPEGNHLNSL